MVLKAWFAGVIVAGHLLAGCTSTDDGYRQMIGGVGLGEIKNAFFLPTVATRRLPDADWATFETISKGPGRWYGKDKRHVYFETKILEGANPAAFQLVQNSWFGTDGVSVFFKHRKLEGANAKTWRPLRNDFSTDGMLTWHQSEIIPDAKGEVTPYLRTDYARDETNQVYRLYGTPDPRPVKDELPEIIRAYRKVDVCDFASFKPFEKNNYAVDDRCAYFGAERIPLGDRASFEILGDPWSKDRTGVYYEDRRVDGADPATAELVYSSTAIIRPFLNYQMRGGVLLRDRNGCFWPDDSGLRPCPADAAPPDWPRQ